MAMTKTENGSVSEVERTDGLTQEVLHFELACIELIKTCQSKIPRASRWSADSVPLFHPDYPGAEVKLASQAVRRCAVQVMSDGGIPTEVASVRITQQYADIFIGEPQNVRLFGKTVYAPEQGQEDEFSSYFGLEEPIAPGDVLALEFEPHDANVARDLNRLLLGAKLDRNAYRDQMGRRPLWPLGR